MKIGALPGAGGTVGIAQLRELLAPALRQRVVGSQAESPAAQGFVVTDIRPRFAEAAGCDIIGKETAQPERIIPQVNHDLEAAVAGGALEVVENVDQIAMALVVVPVDSPGPIALAEPEQDCGEVIRQIAIFQTEPPEGVADEHIEKQRLGRQEHRADR